MSEPILREEKYLAKIAGEDIDISNMPLPSTNVEKYLKQIAQGGASAGMIADAYDAASTYSKDDLCTHEGKLYKAKQDIGTAEAWTAAHWDETTLADELGSADPEAIAEAVSDWLGDHVDPETGYVVDDTLSITDAAADAKKVGDELADLKSALSDVRSPIYNYSQVTNSSVGSTLANGKIRSKSETYSGRIDDSETRKYWYFKVEEDSYVYYTRSGSWASVRISDTAPTVGSTEYTGLYWDSEYTAEAPLFVKADSYIALSTNAGTSAGTVFVSPAQYGLKDTLEMTSAMTEQMNTELFTQKTLNDFGTWVHGYWAGVGDLRNSGYDYRAACSTSIVFQKPTLLVSFEPYYIKGFINGTSFDRTTAILIPKNATVYLYLQQINEDTSVTVDPVELAASVKVVNEYPYDEYNLYSDSFYGLGMFRKIGVCGDSYSAVRLGYSWGQVVAAELGIDVLNFAKSGDDSHAWISDTAHGLPLLLSSDKCDAYWLALGINDASTVLSDPSYLGSSADLSGEDYTQYPNTFWGNQGRIIESIQNYAPNAKIVMFKPIYAKASTAMGVTDSTNLPLIRTAIGQIAEHYNLPVMDALDDIFYRSPEYQNHMDSDISAGNHPSVMLYPGIAHANMRLFSRCVAKYDTYFMGINYSD